jgi:hypothetical protein
MLKIFKYTLIQIPLLFVSLPASAQIPPEVSAGINDMQIELRKQDPLGG